MAVLAFLLLQAVVALGVALATVGLAVQTLQGKRSLIVVKLKFRKTHGCAVAALAVGAQLAAVGVLVAVQAIDLARAVLALAMALATVVCLRQLEMVASQGKAGLFLVVKIKPERAACAVAIEAWFIAKLTTVRVAVGVAVIALGGLKSFPAFGFATEMAVLAFDFPVFAGEGERGPFAVIKAHFFELTRGVALCTQALGESTLMGITVTGVAVAFGWFGAVLMAFVAVGSFVCTAQGKASCFVSKTGAFKTA